MRRDELGLHTLVGIDRGLTSRPGFGSPSMALRRDFRREGIRFFKDRLRPLVVNYLTPPEFPPFLARGTYLVGIEIPGTIDPNFVLQTLLSRGYAVSNIQQDGGSYQFVLTLPHDSTLPNLPGVRLLFIRRLPGF